MHFILICAIILFFVNVKTFCQKENAKTFNHAVDLLSRNSLDSARTYFKSLLSEKDIEMRSRSLFNIGWAFLEKENYDSSMVYFAKSLLLTNDSNARYNYIFSKIKLNKRQEKNKKQNSEKNQSQKQTPKPQSTSKKMSREEAQKILQSLQESEGKILKNVREIENSKSKTKSPSRKRW